MSAMKNRLFEHKVAVVTGAAQGIGRATSLALAAKGATVYCLDIKDVENEETAILATAKSSKKCYSLHCNIADPQQVDKVFKDIISTELKIDILINNAAVFHTISFINDTYESMVLDYDFNMNVNTRGTLLCSKKAAEIMATRRSGHIIHVNTNHIKRHLYSTSDNEHNYDESKFAQMALNESMAYELKQYNIRVNAICPAATRTPMLNNFFEESDLPLTAQRIGEATRIPSILEPEEVAEAICGMLCWEHNAPVGKEYLVMFSKDCKKLAKEPIEEFAK